MKQIILTAIIIFITSSGILYSQDRGRPGDRNKYHDREMGTHGQSCFRDTAFLKEKINLTSDQIDRIEKINSEYKNKLLDLLTKKRPLQRALRILLLTEEIDIARARQLLEEIAVIETELRMANIMHRIEIEKILTTSQKEKLKSEKKDMRKKRTER